MSTGVHLYSVARVEFVETSYNKYLEFTVDWNWFHYMKLRFVSQSVSNDVDIIHVASRM